MQREASGPEFTLNPLQQTRQASTNRFPFKRKDHAHVYTPGSRVDVHSQLWLNGTEPNSHKAFLGVRPLYPMFAVRVSRFYHLESLIPVLHGTRELWRSQPRLARSAVCCCYAVISVALFARNFILCNISNGMLKPGLHVNASFCTNRKMVSPVIF